MIFFLPPMKIVFTQHLGIYLHEEKGGLLGHGGIIMLMWNYSKILYKYSWNFLKLMQ